MAGQIESYRNEIFNFLRTVTIKFEPFAYLMGRDYMDEYGLSDPHGDWNPYYQNLIGEYSTNDTRMTVYSLEDEIDVPYDKNLLTKYPKTAALYRIPNSEYTTLEERYPENIGLIRTIAYPVKDMETALKAPNLSLLAYDASLLEMNERESLIGALEDYLDMMRTRWYIPEYTYEDMYSTTFWICLWQHLPLVLLVQRIKNIGTPYVHSFHVWESLISKGLADYRDVLTTSQANWLYRNMEWILQNQGKNETLTELAKNLLEEISVSLQYKDMVQGTTDRWHDIITTPEFPTSNIVTGEQTGVENFESINNKLVDSGFETNNSADYIDKTEQELGQININELPTKFLEFKKNPINTANEVEMINFFLQTLVYRLHENHIGVTVEFVDPYSGVTLELGMQDVLLLYNWSIFRSLEETDISIPSGLIVNLPFKKDQVLASQFRPYIYYNNHKYRVASLVNVDGVVAILGNDWHPRAFTDKVDWIDTLAEQFRDRLLLNRYIEESNDYLYHDAMTSVMEDMTVHGTLRVKLTNAKTYTEYFNSVAGLSEIIDTYEGLGNNKEYYTTLASRCVDVMFPLSEATSTAFVSVLKNMETIYNSVRDLFIQLCSYNVTFLETERESNWYLPYRDPDIMFPGDVRYELSYVWYLIYQDFQCRGKFNQNLNATEIPFEFHVGDTSKLEMTWKDEIPVEYPIASEIEWSEKLSISASATEVKVPVTTILNLKIYVDGVSITKR